jgi:hypothetical protein
MKRTNKIGIMIIFTIVLLLLSNTVISQQNKKEIKLFKYNKSFTSKNIIQEFKTKTVLGHKRIITDSISEKDFAQLKNRGCLIKHRLSHLTSFECPENVVSTLQSIQKLKVREARIFHIVGLKSAQQINADDVWVEGINGEGANIIILDTGVDSSHPELSDSYLGGYDFVENDNNPQDNNGHGTHVAGIITANGIYTVNGKKATGVAPNAGFYMLKVCNGEGLCFEDDIMAALEYAVNNLDAKIISISIGDGNFGSHCDSDPLAAKVNWAVDNGYTIVISAGNDGNGVSSPACASKAIAVGAVDEDGVVTSWSNRGTALDIIAPGVNILSTYSCLAIGDCSSIWYAYMSGTSMATPHIAGVIALLLDENPDLTDAEIKNILYTTTDPAAGCYKCRFIWRGRCYGLYVASCTKNEEGAGVVNAYQAYLSVKQQKQDLDQDGIIDSQDNCPNIPNPNQEDIDNDGIGDVCDNCTDIDQDTYCVEVNDCNDNDVSINPEATDSVCDGIDNDCDSLIDEDYVSYSCGIGNCKVQSECVNGIENCTPATPSIEICDGIDNDCDSLIDEEEDLAAPLCEKQVGVCAESTRRCGGTSGWLSCDATNYGLDYEVIETICSDSLDNDCDGLTDSDDSDCLNCVDIDNDGYYAISVDCPMGDDCNDTDASINPGIVDNVCNGIDNDCDNSIDEDYVATPTYCGIGACSSIGELECQSGTEVDTCVEGTPTTELCNDIDDDCDNLIDEGDVCDVVKCWDGNNGYLKRSTSQFRKFCKCVEGNFRYKRASYVWATRQAYQYIDTGNNENWETTAISNFLPAYRIQCSDGEWYYTNLDYYYG